MFIPTIQATGKTLLLQNYLTITDISTDTETAVVALCRNDVELTFYNDDADIILDSMVEILKVSDSISQPIVGIDSMFLILPNFILTEFENERNPKIVLTTDTGKEIIFKGQNALLIQSRMESYSAFSNQISNLFHERAQGSDFVN